MRVDEGDIEEERRRGIALCEEVHSAVYAPETVHLFFGQVVRATDPAIGGGTVGHTGVDVVAAVALLQPFDIVVLLPAGGVGQLSVVEAEAPARRMEVHLAAHLGQVAGLRA